MAVWVPFWDPGPDPGQIWVLAGTLSLRVEIFHDWVQTFFRCSVMGVIRSALHSEWFGGSGQKNLEKLH
jgi:hypothetical protein